MESTQNTWTPVTGGEETSGLLDRLSIGDESKRNLIDEAANILSLCGNPSHAESSSVGLAFGYVQSGKTMSFTTLTTLARDNGYQIIIIIAGISTALVNQSTERLMDDLDLRRRFDRKWIGVIQNPIGPSVKEQIETVLSEWKHPTFPEDERRSVLITVMKNTHHLLNLVGVLEDLDLRGVPVLIIDDESDQASLNTRERRNALDGLDDEDIIPESHQSTIFRRIDAIRELCPHHSLVQYTATPQANLFINILNRLSPNFIQLLTPGVGYTGGQRYFVQEQHLVRAIPGGDIPSDDNILDEPPASLINALQQYFVGAVVGKVRRDARSRSMMIHPSRLQFDQNWYHVWVTNIVQRFVLTLQQDDNDADKIELLREFRNAYDDLSQTDGDLPEFGSLIGRVETSDRLEHVINSTQIELVNSSRGRTPMIDWQNEYSHILIGGQAMSRGFTVEGLTVTYMPRSIGVGNVDTIQQRARFFGYKSSYIGLCRVYLDRQSIDAYTQYVEHEQILRSSLESHRQTNRHLNDWERKVVLGNAYRIARNNIFANQINRERFIERWITIDYPHFTLPMIRSNRFNINSFISKYRDDFIEDQGDDRRTEEQRHYALSLNLNQLFDELLNNISIVEPDDSNDFTNIMTLIQYAIEHDQDLQAEVYIMSKGSNRNRRVTSDGLIQEYFQGSNRRTGYEGDRSIKDPDLLTVQIHSLNILSADGNNTLHGDVYGLTFWIPSTIGKVFTTQGDLL